MANVLQELLNVCRFCLCENKQDLKPIVERLDSTLTADEIERYTGIQVNTDEDCALYAMCMECTTKLRNSTEFRQICLNNQTHFEELLMMLVASAESTHHEPADSEKCTDITESTEDTMIQTAFVDLTEEDDNSSEPKQIHSPNNTEPPEVVEYIEEEEMYCANYIEPDKSYHSESDDIWETPTIETKKPRKKYTYKKYDCTVKEPIVGKEPKRRKTYEFSILSQSECYYIKTYKDVKRIYMKMLCEVCGKLVKGFATHMDTHSEVPLHSCPHCPAKMKTKNNLSEHIKTVHQKIVGKTCNICGKGFIHHKTYRYHMLAHQSEGKAFECKLCAKKFDKPFGLRDHYNRVHNMARNSKKK